MTRVRLAKPDVGEPELEAVRQVLDTGYLTQGPKALEFERRIGTYLGGAHAISTTSATTALHLAMQIAGVSAGDEVVLPSFTFPATANVVIQQGAIPVLADIDLATFNMSVDSLRDKITPATKAVIAVHLFGLPANMPAILDVVRPLGIPVVEDAACALGAGIGDAPCGTLGDMACFSFHPRKIITTGEGGMFTTADADMAARARRLRQHGGERIDNRFHFVEPGYNYRMSDVNAAIGLAQMDRLEGILVRRRELAAMLSARLAAIAGVQIPQAPPGYGHTYQAYVVLLDEGIDRDRVIAAMAERGVETTIGTYALHAERYIQERYQYSDADLPASWRAWRQALALPLYPGMTDEDVETVVSTLADSL